jgi:hypothetical protein
MDPGSDYGRTVESLDAAVEASLSEQVLDEDREDDGGVVVPAFDMASPAAGGTPSFVAAIGLAYLTPASSHHGEQRLLERVRRGMAFQRRAQRPSGCIDLVTANFDSPPDTAFTVPPLAKLVRAARRSDVPGADAVEASVGPYLRSAGEGVLEGGFHTFNHRWVMVSALAQVHGLYPDDRYPERIEAFLAEGIDVNADGAYSERSHGIYDHVVNRSLIDAARVLDRPELLDPVRRNLECLCDFLRPDWSVVTHVSTRQDRDRRLVPTRGAPNFYYLARLDGDERFAAAARGLLDAGGWSERAVLIDLLDHFETRPDWRDSDLPAGERPDAVSRQLTASGVWRLRDGDLDATVATGTERIVALSYGGARLAGVAVVSPYFGWAAYEADRIRFGEDRATLRLDREYYHADVPGYWEPLGREVAWGDLERDARDANDVPNFAVELAVERVDSGLRLDLTAEEGLEGVPFALELRFPAAGRLDLAGGSVPAADADPVFLESGTATYHRDRDAITVGPGFGEHRLSEPAVGSGDPEGALRVLLTDYSPVERTVTITGGPREA